MTAQLAPELGVKPGFFALEYFGHEPADWSGVNAYTQPEEQDDLDDLNCLHNLSDSRRRLLSASPLSLKKEDERSQNRLRRYKKGVKMEGGRVFSGRELVGGRSGARPFERQRKSATTLQTASTIPNGHAPCRNP